ncbi:MAG: sigma-70 family RNA polymerase sigma factor [Planctomycetes bacterium]|nr:sigma-70 family RNA polymerase sigma factor [Planctomycetota bacterium]
MNDREWIQEALRRYEPRLLLYAAKVCGRTERARDVVQETFLELCAAKRDAVEGHLAAWLFTVCRNKAFDALRKDEGMETTDDVGVIEHRDPAVDPARSLAQGEEHARVLRLMTKLPAKQQEALRLKFQGGLSYKEIAAVMGESVSNVGFLIHVALKALRERMAVEGPERKVAS